VENCSGLKTDPAFGVVVELNRLRTSSGRTGVGEIAGVKVSVGVSEIVGVSVMVGVRVIVDVIVTVGDGGKTL
jgi:hypothetical protein